MPVGSDSGNEESFMESNGRRLFSALKELQRRIMGFHPAAEIRPSEFMMLHSMLCCLMRRLEEERSARQTAAPQTGEAHDVGQELRRWVESSGCPGVKIGELSAFTHQTPSGVSQTIRALEEKGLVQRETLSSDRRSVYVRPTGEGWALARHMEEDFFSRLETLADEMGEEETNQLIALVDRLLAIIDRHRAEEAAEGPPAERAPAVFPPAPGHPCPRDSHTERMDEAR